MSQVVIFSASHGRTLSATLYTTDGLTLVASASACVEQSTVGGAMGMYAATFTGVPVGTYLLSAFDTVPANDDMVYIPQTSGTFLCAGLGSYAILAANDPELGPGASPCTLDFLQGSVPIPNAQVWITSDADGTVVVAGTAITNANGQVTFMLTVGLTYYMWFVCPGYNSIRGQAFVASTP